MANYGRIDKTKLAAAAKRAGIPAEELERELEARGLKNVTFITGH